MDGGGELMGFRFRRRTKILPGLYINWSKNGLSSLSVGGPGATINLPVAREGGTRSTVGLPGTGLSYSHQESVRQRQQRQRQGTQLPTTEATIQELMAAISGPDCVGDALWRQGLAQRVIDYPDTPRRVREAALLVRSPEAAELHCRRARGKAATIKASREVVHAIETVLQFTEAQGWSRPAD